MNIVILDVSVNKNSKLSQIDIDSGNYGKIIMFDRSKVIFDKIMQELEEIKDAWISEEQEITEVGQPLTQDEYEVLEDMGLLSEVHF